MHISYVSQVRMSIIESVFKDDSLSYHSFRSDVLLKHMNASRTDSKDLFALTDAQRRALKRMINTVKTFNRREERQVQQARLSKRLKIIKRAKIMKKSEMIVRRQILNFELIAARNRSLSRFKTNYRRNKDSTLKRRLKSSRNRRYRYDLNDSHNSDYLDKRQHKEDKRAYEKRRDYCCEREERSSFDNFDDLNYTRSRKKDRNYN